MFTVIDCGTTFTRIFVVDDKDHIVASGREKIGVRDTAISGKIDILRKGIEDLYNKVLKDNQIDNDKISFAIASGMITSETGLIEIPHLMAPIGIEDLANNIIEVEANKLLNIGCPILFVPGIRNSYGGQVGIKDLCNIDFMRGEEVQCVGIMQQQHIQNPCSIVALSSHTKIIFVDSHGRITASSTTISGQLYEAIVQSTNIGKSITLMDNEGKGKYSYEELLDAALECVSNYGLVRTMLMPRLMEVLLQTTSWERQIFADAAIAVDDLKIFDNMRHRGLANNEYVLYGQENRCKMYEYFLKKRYGKKLKIRYISDMEQINKLTIQGSIAIAKQYLQQKSCSK